MSSHLPLHGTITVAGIHYRVRAEHDPTLGPDPVSFNTSQRQQFTDGQWVFVTVTVSPIIDAVAISEQVHGIDYRTDTAPSDGLDFLVHLPAVGRALVTCRERLAQIAAAITPTVAHPGRVGVRAMSAFGDTLTQALTPAQFATAVPALAGYRLAEIAAALADIAPDGPAVLLHEGTFYDVTGRYAFALRHGFSLHSAAELLLPPPWSGHSRPLPVAVADTDDVHQRLHQARLIAARATGIDIHAAARLMADLSALTRDLAAARHEHRLVLDATITTADGLIEIAGRLSQHLYQHVYARDRLAVAATRLTTAVHALTSARQALPDPQRDQRQILEPRLAEVTLVGGETGWKADAIIRDRYQPHREEIIVGEPATSPALAVHETQSAAEDVPGYRAPTRDLPAILHAPADPRVDRTPLGPGFTDAPGRRSYQLVAHIDGPADPIKAAEDAYPAIAALAAAGHLHAAQVQRDTDDGTVVHQPIICRPTLGDLPACLRPAHHRGACAPQPDPTPAPTSPATT